MLKVEATKVVQVPLLLTLNIFGMSFIYFANFEHINARQNTSMP